MAKNGKFIPKELSWFSFNNRVLQEVENPNNPLIERIKFLGIYSNNQDEFFRVRVATLKRFLKLGDRAKEILGEDPKILLEQIQQVVNTNRERLDTAYDNIKHDLQKYNIHLVDETQYCDQHRTYLEHYFHDKVRPLLMPIILNNNSAAPELKDDAVYFAVIMKIKGTISKYAFVKIPSNRISRFVVLPAIDNRVCITLIDDVIRIKLADIFKTFPFDSIEAYAIKITKDAELELDDNIAVSYIDRVASGLKARKKGVPVRFIYDGRMPDEPLNFFIRLFRFKNLDVMLKGGKYHNFRDYVRFPNIGVEECYYPPMPQILIERLEQCNSILREIKKRDVFIYCPYFSFDYFIELLREVSIDPTVSSIKITLYRLGKNSSVVNALINALRNGKEVVVLIELQARFDEEANIQWSRKLQEEGAKIIYGVPGLKVHSKLCLITRTEGSKAAQYACVSTGNFNEDTAQFYTDAMLFTADKRITDDVHTVFNFFSQNYRRDSFHHLIVSPFHQRDGLKKLIETEVINARLGKPAFIKMKLNNITDYAMIEQLYSAADAGVKIQLHSRSMISAVSDEHPNMEVRALVDRFLEHSRIIIFCNGGNHKVYVTSADWMTRNLDRRVEVSCPIYNKNIQAHLEKIFDTIWSDNQKNRIINRSQCNAFVQPIGGEVPVRAQYALYDYFKSVTL